MSSHLTLFCQLPIGARFTFESPSNPDIRVKTSKRLSHREKVVLFGGLPTPVNGGILVFEVKKDNPCNGTITHRKEKSNGYLECGNKNDR